MELFGHIGIAILSLIITWAANTAAHVLPRQQAQPPAQAATTMQSTDLGIEYSSLQSAALGKELKYAVMLPPSYKAETKRRYPVLYFLHGMFGNEGEFEKRHVAAKVASLREQGLIGEFIIVAPAGGNSFYLNSKSG
ncbi:MAG TPA: alpha/beta hydrolase-fold protein, partial [Blastocatellia bacterium]|nr:alpha/beta hydrolase-fold protein [Blastocatellia bacterium]